MPLTGAYDGQPAMSANGRYVAFVSDAHNFAPVVSGTRNVFLKDRVTGVLELVNQVPEGQLANGALNPALSADARFVAYASSDTFGPTDVFVRDRQLNVTTRMSSAIGGGSASGPSGRAVEISGDGRFVAFTSSAANLVAGDTNGQYDVFVRDRESGAIEEISPVSVGVPQFTTLSMSADGRYIAFSGLDPARPGPAINALDVLVYDRNTQMLEAVSVSSDEARGDAGSSYPSISADGRYVVFTSTATNLASGGLPGYPNVYLRDRLNGTTRLISRSAPTSPGWGSGDRGVISPDGRFVTFATYSPVVLPDSFGQTSSLYLLELETDIVRHVDVTTVGTLSNSALDTLSRPSFSADGRYLVFESQATNLDPADQSSGLDVFARDLVAETTTLVSTGTDGAQGVTGAESGDAVLSADGSMVAFRSNAYNLVADDHNQAWDVFVNARNGGAPELISVSTDGIQAEQSPEPFNSLVPEIAMSADGRYVAFVSAAPNLVGDDHNDTWDVFVRDRTLHTTVRADVSSDGVEANGQVQRGGGRHLAISGDGRYVIFSSQASNLVPGDNNSSSDLFARDLVAHTTERISIGVDGAEANGSSLLPSVSSDGRYVAFFSVATNLVAENAPGGSGLFLRDRETETTVRVDLNSTGQPVQPESWPPVLSGNGRYVAFVSYDSAVVPGDTNDVGDVFVRDVQANTTERVSLGIDGEQLFQSSTQPAISDDGRFVGFRRDQNGGEYSLLLRDRLLNTTSRVDLNPNGSESNTSSVVTLSPGAIGANGKYLAFSGSSQIPDPFRTSGGVDVFVRTRVTPANTPESLTATVENRKIRLNWLDRSDDESGFKLQRRKEGAGFQDLVTLPVGSTTYLDAAIEWDTAYTYRVLARSDFGDSAFSNEASLVIPLPVPEAPADLAAVPLSQTSVRLDWDDVSSVEAGFAIERSTNGGQTFAALSTVGANVETYTDTNLTANTTYVYRVKATNASGSSPESETATATTLPNAPAAPSGFYVSLLSDTGFRLIWASSSHDTTGFRLERKAIGEDYQLVAIFPAGSIGFNDSGLLPNRSYTYRLRAFNAGGESEWVERSGTTGTTPAGKLHVATKLDFGAVRVGKMASRNLKVRNRSRTESLRFSVDSLETPYTLVSSTTDVYVTRGGLRDIWINFRPTTKGKKTIRVRLVSTDPKKPTVLVTLTGRGK